MAAGVLQTVWVIALRQTQGFTRLGPIVVYAVVGLATTLCLSRSFEGIPMSTAYSVWMGVSILGSVVIDAVAARNLDLSKAFCILLILAGAAGLKLGEKADMLSELPAATRRANSGCDRGVSP
jgi:quaternary ammonium compound-resistance protein SugE